MTEFQTTVVIKTFLRPRCCEANVRFWCQSFPGIPIIVVDDSAELAELDLRHFPNVTHVKTPFDIGLSAGRNIGMEHVKTEFAFLCDDDNVTVPHMDFGFLESLMTKNDLAILGCGAFLFDIVNEHLQIRSAAANSTDFLRADATLNHFLCVPKRIPRWDERLKLAPEHADFFLECKRQFVPVAGSKHVRLVKLASFDSEAHKILYVKYRLRREWDSIFYSKWNIESRDTNWFNRSKSN